MTPEELAAAFSAAPSLSWLVSELSAALAQAEADRDREAERYIAMRADRDRQAAALATARAEVERVGALLTETAIEMARAANLLAAIEAALPEHESMCIGRHGDFPCDCSIGKVRAALAGEQP